MLGMLKSPEVSLKQKVLRTVGALATLYAINPSHPVHAEVDNGEGSYSQIGDIKRQYPQCNGNNTEWVISGENENKVLNLGPLDEQCGNGHLPNTLNIVVGGKNSIRSGFYPDRYLSEPIKGISCPEGFQNMLFEGDPKETVVSISYAGNPKPDFHFTIHQNAKDQEGVLIQYCAYFYINSKGALRYTGVPFREVHYKIEAPRSLDEFRASFGAVKGDSNYVEKYDQNDDGVINVTDFSLLRDKLTQ